MTVAGHLGQANPLRQNMRFHGQWQQHHKFGLQLACTDARLLEDDPPHRALSEVTCQISGIGQVKAEALMAAFGDKLVQVHLFSSAVIAVPLNYTIRD